MYRVKENGENFQVITDHLERRAQQRGVSSDTIDLIAWFGKKTRVKGGKFQRMIRQSDAKRLIEYGISTPSDVDRTKGIKLITGEDIHGNMVIVTVYHRKMHGSYKWTA